MKSEMIVPPQQSIIDEMNIASHPKDFRNKIKNTNPQSIMAPKIVETNVERESSPKLNVKKIDPRFVSSEININNDKKDNLKLPKLNPRFIKSPDMSVIHEKNEIGIREDSSKEEEKKKKKKESNSNKDKKGDPNKEKNPKYYSIF